MDSMVNELKKVMETANEAIANKDHKTALAALKYAQHIANLIRQRELYEQFTS